MVIYFSATGNTKLIAETLAQKLNDKTLDLLSRLKAKDYSAIHSEKPFVICTPVYVSELPTFITGYLKKVSFTGSCDVYGVLTNGGYSGIAGGQMKKIIRQKNLHFKGYAEFKLASNHITNKSHKEIDDAEIINRIKTSLSKAEEAAAVIQKGESFQNRHLFLLEYAVTVPVAPVLCYFNQKTEGFRATEQCISCQKCVRLCPMNVIKMQDGKPVWKDKRCAHCMSCIQNCPKDAIEYKDTTVGKKRYSVARVNYKQSL